MRSYKVDNAHIGARQRGDVAMIRRLVRWSLVTLTMLSSADLTVGQDQAAKAGGAWFDQLPIERRIEIQKRLDAMGFRIQRADGRYGVTTRAAIQKFQSSRGAPVSGILTETEAAELVSGKNSGTSVPAIEPATSGKKWKLVGNSDRECGPARETIKSIQAAAKFTVSNTSIAAGDLASVSWTTPETPVLSGPTYLVISVSEPVRFAGESGYALTANATAPFGIRHAQSESRFIVPLHVQGSARSGTVGVRAIQSGVLSIKSAIVGFSNCGEVGHETPALFTVSVRPGTPTISVVNTFSLSRPDAVTQSPTGLHRIETYGSRFLLIENATGVKLADRIGARPRFSPSGRFVISLPETGGEVIDALDGAIIHSVVDGDIAWDKQDSIVVSGAHGGGNIQVLSTLAENRTLAHFSLVSCRICRATETAAFKVDWENNVAIAVGDLENESQILTTDARYNNNDHMFNESTVKKYGTLYKFLAIHSQVVEFDFPTRWELEEGLRFSHILGDQVPATKAQPADPLMRFLVRQSTANPSLPAAQAHGTEPLQLATRGVQLSKNAPEQKQRTVESRLAEFGFDIRSGTKLRRSGSNIRTMRKGTDPSGDIFALINDPRIVIDATSHMDRCGELVDTPGGGKRLFTYQPKFFEVRGSNFLITIASGLCDGGSAGFLNHTTVLHDSRKPGQLLHLEPLVGRGPDNIGTHCSISIVACPFEGELFDNRYLVIWLGEAFSTAVFDLQSNNLIQAVWRLPNPAVMRRVILSRDGKSLLKLDTDGGFAQIDLARSQKDAAGKFTPESLKAPVRLEGMVVEDEVVAWNQQGQFDATAEGASYVSVRFPGRAGSHTLEQYRSVFFVPGLIGKMASGHVPAPSFPSSYPPEITVEQKVEPGIVSGRVKLEGDGSWVSVAVYQDGRRTDVIDVEKGERQIAFNVKRMPGARWFAFVARNADGLFSRPITFDARSGSEPKRRLHLMIAGVDQSTDPKLPPLKFARSDAFRFWQAMKARPSDDTEIAGEALLLNAQAGRDSILASLRSIVASASTSDTVVLFFAGHGLRDKDGRLYLATPETRLADLPGSALAWSDAAAVLRESKARVVVFLDTCHSGAVSADALATNDASSQTLLNGATTSMVIFSASKGRELSEEQSARNGGVFTSALIETLASTQSDRNRNGALEASELFVGVKNAVVRATDGRQTPWLTRNEMIGDFSLF